MTTVGDLAFDWSWMETYAGFRFPRGRTVWEQATASKHCTSVRVSRLVVTENGIRQINQYVDPEKPIEFAGLADPDPNRG